MTYYCPLCGNSGLFLRVSNISLATSAGGGGYVCTGCAKTKMTEIKKRNEIYNGRKGTKKDPKCQHKWVHPYRGRWFCVKCGATYNWMCGCGGSGYVCDEHYIEMITEYKPIEEYLAKHSW